MFNYKQYLNSILIPTLSALSMDNDSMRMLLAGTCAHESLGGTYIYQLNGPALGIMQIEPATHNSMWQVYLPNQPILTSRLMSLCHFSRAPQAEAMISNLLYSTAMAAILYKWRIEQARESFPVDLVSAAECWKKHYNTYLGKGKVEDFIRHYEQFTGSSKKQTLPKKK